jgi:hypothetical protein
MEFYDPYRNRLLYIWHMLTRSHMGANTDAVLLFEPPREKSYWADICSCGLEVRR